MTRRIRLGFIPLVDAALPIVAARMGFAEAEGLELELIREVSWANIRDKLTLGFFEAAHMLAPAAIASSLGLGHVTMPLVAPLTLNLNGNAITIEPRLAEAIAADIEASPGDPVATARALAAFVRRRAAEGQPPLTFGHVFPFSTHHYQLRRWLASGGLDPDRDVRLVVLPPAYMVDSLAKGQLDGFCVGAPWNSIAVEAGAGRILHFGLDVVPDAPEKVLALRQETGRAEPETVTKLVRALRSAAVWAEDPGHRDALVALLAEPDLVGHDPALLHRVLAGTLTLSRGGPVRTDAAYLRLGAAVLRPDPAHADWCLGEMAAAGQVAPERVAELGPIARAVYDQAAYDAALA